MTDIVSIDRNTLIINTLSINEYYYLSLLNTGLPLSLEDMVVCGKLDYEYLERCGFIKITEEGAVIRQKAKELFEVTRDNFYRFLSTFPIKTPKGRYLSPAGLEGVAVNALKIKWNRLFKKNIPLENKVIRVLEAEMDYRKKEGNMEYMTACEAWLNGAFYEKYEYLLEDAKATVQAEHNELM